MGSFSWNVLGDSHGILNIYYGRPVKILIPKEYGGGYVAGKYDDYGRFFDGTPHSINLYEWIAAWNVVEDDLSMTDEDISSLKYIPYHIKRECSNSELLMRMKALGWKDVLEKHRYYFETLKNRLPVISEKTNDIEGIGIMLGCYDKNHANLAYPLRIVDFRENVSYEDLKGFSSEDENFGVGFTKLYESLDEEAFIADTENEWIEWKKNNPASTNPFFAF